MANFTSKRSIAFVIVTISYMTLFGCQEARKERSVELKYQIYCGNCHSLPNPGNITKSVWEKKVLPEMAARLGLKSDRYNPLAGNSMEENMYIRRTNTYPEQPQIDTASWNQIHDYVLRLAPDLLPIDSGRVDRGKPIKQFIGDHIGLDSNPIAQVTNVQYDTISGHFVVNDAFGASYWWPSKGESFLTSASALTSYTRVEDHEYITEIGYMNPSDKPQGTLWRRHGNEADTLAKQLHRPVHTNIIDINDDGNLELVICEFGNLGGQLSLVSAENEFQKKTLLPLPGTIKTEIYDMNGDGRKDIIALASQGKEGIYILYQEDELEFTIEQVIKMGPEYGTSWFELLDYDKDGDMDIVLANGDNADYSVIPKPYHGVRLFLNDQNSFEEDWFYPVYGATRVLSEDYDLDGDFDFAVMSFFPEYSEISHESFVYLENKDQDQYVFEPFTLEGLPKGRWLVMDNGDVDNDGDIDLLLGSFILPPDRNRRAMLNHWREEKVDLLFLKNLAIQR